MEWRYYMVCKPCGIHQAFRTRKERDNAYRGHEKKNPTHNMNKTRKAI